jgi:hypothetical protein
MKPIALLLIAASIVLPSLALPAVVVADGPAVKRFAVPVDGAPSTGPADAPVTVVEFLDFQ